MGGPVTEFATLPEGAVLLAPQAAPGLPGGSDPSALPQGAVLLPRENVRPPPETAPSRGIVTPEAIDQLIQVESGGDVNAVSPKGAQGAAQAMPETAANPGFGVKPLIDPNNLDQSKAFAAEYMRAMMDRYGDPSTALMAYNWGPGHVDDWIKAGRNPEDVPRETRNYVARLMPAFTAPEGQPSEASALPQGATLLGQKPAPQQKASGHGELYKGFVGGTVAQNPAMFGSALEALGLSVGLEDVANFGSGITKEANARGANYVARVPGIQDIRTDNIGDMWNDFTDWAAYGVGQGLSSTLPTVATGAAGALITQSPIGAIAGAVGPSYFLNLGDMHEQLKDELKKKITDGDVSRQDVARTAALVAIPLAALDIGGATKILGIGAKEAFKKTLARKIAARVAEGVRAEGITEVLQQIIEEFTAAKMSGHPDIENRTMNVVNAGLVGAMTGGLLGPVAGGTGERINREQGGPPPPSGGTPQETPAETTQNPPQAAPTGAAAETGSAPSPVAPAGAHPAGFDANTGISVATPLPEEAGVAASAPEGGPASQAPAPAAGSGSVPGGPSSETPSARVRRVKAEAAAAAQAPLPGQERAAQRRSVVAAPNAQPEPSAAPAAPQAPQTGAPAPQNAAPAAIPFSDFMSALPKDENGDADVRGVGHAILQGVAPGKTWAQMTPDEQATAMRAANPQSVEAQNATQSLAAAQPTPTSEQPAAAPAPKPKRAPKPRAPVDVNRFLAQNSGVRDDEGHAPQSQRNLQKFVPGAGPLIRKNGMSIDQAGERLYQAGYFGPMETTERPTVAQVLDLLEKANTQKTFVPEVQAEQQMAQEDARGRQQEADARAEIEEFAKEINEKFTKDDVDAILSIMAQYNVNGEVATEIYAERLGMQAVNAMVEYTGDPAYENYDPASQGQAEAAPFPGAERPPGPAAGQGTGAQVAPNPQEAGNPADNAAAGAPAVEPVQTIDGVRDQYVIPGAEQNAQAAQQAEAAQGAEQKRLQGQQSMMRRGGQASPESQAGGLFANAAARDQGSMMVAPVTEPMVTYPDANHRALAEYGQRLLAGGKSEFRTRGNLWLKFRGFVEDQGDVAPSAKPSDIDQLAMDYAQEIQDGGTAGSVVDPDLEAQYLREQVGLRESRDVVSPTFRAASPDIAAGLKRILGEIAPGAKMEVVDNLFADIGGKKSSLAGAYVAANQMVTVALAGNDPVATLRHEAIHHLRTMRLFTQQEWNALEEKARGTWMNQYEVEKLYPDLTHNEQVEEAIAIAFGKHRTGETFVPGFRRIFEKIGNLLARFGNLMRGYGFRTAEDIFEKIDSGEIGGRKDAESLAVAHVAQKQSRVEPQAELSADEQSALEEMAKLIGAPKRTIRERLADVFSDNFMDRVKQWTFDDLHSINVLERMANAGKLFTDARSAYKLARLTRGINDLVMAAMYDGAPVWSEGTWAINESVKAPMKILDELGERASDFEKYLVARRANELMTQGKENLFDQRMIDAGLALEKVYLDFKQHAADLYKYNSRLLDFVQNSGLIDPDTRALFEEMHKNYVPFWRVMENEKGFNGPTAKMGFSGQHPNFWKLKGSERNVERPFVNMEHNIHRLIEAAAKNVVMLRVEQLNAQVGGAAMDKIGRQARKVLVSTKQMVDDLKSQGLEITSADNVDIKALRALWSLGNAPRGQNIVSLVRGGEVFYYQVKDPLLYESLTMIHRRQPFAWLAPARAARHVLTAAVGLDPSFQVANIFRDTIHSAVVSHIGFVPVIDSLRGGAARIRDTFSQNGDPMWREFLRAGAGMSSVLEAGGMSQVGRIEKKLGMNLAGRLIQSPKDMLAALQHAESTLEYATRVGAYRKLREQGVNRMEAAYQARDVSTDFAMKGTGKLLQFFTDTVPFLNAGLQGLYRTGRGASENLLSFLVKGSMITSASLALYLMNRDDDRYKQLTDYEKDLYWHFFIGDQHFRLPKPFEVGAFFGSVPERLLDSAINQNPAEFFERMGWIIQNQWRVNPVPQVVRPILTVYSNWDEFRQSTVVPPWLDSSVRPEEQYDDRTPLVAIEAGRLTHVSPAKIEALVQGYLGAIGTYSMVAADQMLTTFGQYPQKPTVPWTEYPAVRRFVGPKTPNTTQYVQEFYQMRDEANRTWASVQRLIADGEVDRAQQIIRENPDLIAVRKALDTVGKQMAKIQRTIHVVRVNKEMVGNEKRDQIDRLRAARNKLAETIVPLKAAAERAKARKEE